MDAYLEELSQRFARMRPRLEVIAARIIGNHEDAADIVSEVYVALAQSPPRRVEALPAWLSVVVRNRAINRLRQKEFAAGLDETAEPESVAAIEEERIAELLSDAIARLSERDAAFVRARFFEGAGADELADEHGTTVPQARIVLHRAVGRLRKHVVTLLAEHHGVPDAHRDAVLAMVAKGEFAVECGCPACRALGDELSALRKLRGIGPVGQWLSRNYLKKVTVGLGAAAIVVGLGPSVKVPDAVGAPNPAPAPEIRSAPLPVSAETMQDVAHELVPTEVVHASPLPEAEAPTPKKNLVPKTMPPGESLNYRKPADVPVPSALPAAPAIDPLAMVPVPRLPNKVRL